MDNTGCLDYNVFHADQQKATDFKQTKCQYRKIKIIQSLISIDDIINNQVKPVSPKNEGKD